MDASTLADLPLSYDEVGATGATLPDGYDHRRVSEVVGTGRETFERLGTAIMTWGIQQGAGIAVAADSSRATVGANVLLGLQIGPIRVDAPCRVVHAVETRDRIGFTYGTLRGHPAMGEESFAASIDADETVRFEIVAFSRPASIATRLAGPIPGWVESRATRRYVRAARAAGR